MKRDRVRSRFALIVVVACAGFFPLHAQEDCKATLSSQLRGTHEKDTVVRHVFKVDVSTSEACAEIDFVLSTTEQLPSGETKVFETPGKVRLRSGSTSQKLNYDLKKANKLVEWKIEQRRCTRCQP